MADSHQQPEVVDTSAPGRGERVRHRLRPGRIITFAIVFLLLGALASLATVMIGARAEFVHDFLNPPPNEDTLQWWNENKPSQFKEKADTVLSMENTWGKGKFLIAGDGQVYQEDCYVFRLGFPIRFCQGTVWHVWQRPSLQFDSGRLAVTYKRWENWLGEPDITNPDAGVYRIESTAVPMGFLLRPAILNWGIWSLVLFTAYLLLISGFHFCRVCKRQRRGLCPHCGYPMGESPRCTECGALLDH